MASSATTATIRAAQSPSTSKLPKNPNANSPPDPPNANPNPISNSNSLSTAAAESNPLNPSLDEVVLFRATHLTRPEVLRLRSRRLKRLARCYRDHYWALMEELKVQYREYYWEYGISPYKQTLSTSEEARETKTHDLEYSADNPHSNPNHKNNIATTGASGKGDAEAKSNNPRCAFVGCKFKAMALTSFCHLHILSDTKQKLYKPCSFVIKSAQAGPITCGKPILRSTVPSLCAVHFQKAQKHVTRSLRKAGLNVASSNKFAPNFHIIVAEYVKQIQTKRKVARDANQDKVEAKKETAG
ncbi:hypothetical protein SAY87_003764 [Trapa incisa]|uniref:KAT8 regulatory NSL complex subunit 2 n=1 Tax=Trapa incisa TaxID=236973 RepID=A0AAN7KPX1_9MYRT|nr:hypothetical protein SAY87_003764 [Trapa incisa]